MDDVPASPACPGPRSPTLTVVIPVHNGGAAFTRCLRGLRPCWRADYELVVIDDGSTDDSAEQALAAGARLIRHPRPLGPAAARNDGAAAARAPIVFFLDSDVVLHPDALARTLDHLDRRPGLSALFGSYDDRPTARGLVTQYRNLLHHFVHQQGEFTADTRPAHTFWTGCGAIRRDVFLALGGFDPALYRRPAIEDIEFGYRLAQAGHSILLARDVLATHLKKWTLKSVLLTDIFHRGVPWMLLMMRSHVHESDLNVSPGQRLSVAAVGLALAGLMASPWLPILALLFPLGLAAQALLNRPFYRFLRARRGLPFTIASFPLHTLYFVCCGLSVGIAGLIRVSQELRASSKALARGRSPSVVRKPHIASRPPLRDRSRQP
jgi:GT2 family glycosyltransferase